MIDVNLFGSDELKLFKELRLKKTWQEMCKDYNV